MRASFVIAGLAVLLVGVFLTTVFFWSISAASSSSANENDDEWQLFALTGAISAAGAALMIAGIKLKDK
jgi:hypothetical protein